MRLSLHSLLPIAICGALLASAGAASAGVIVDPNGPASKQYSAGLDRARQQGTGSGGSAGVPGSTARAPLFGKGISPKNASGGNQGSDAGGSEAGGSSSSASASLGSDGGGSNTLEIAGISLAVVLAGGLLALAARGLRRAA